MTKRLKERIESKEVFPCETVHYPPQLYQGAGAATALTAVSVGAPAAFAEETNCFFGDKADVTILYTNDVHTYIDNKSPKPTYAAIAALKKSIEGRPAGMCCWWMQATISRAPLTVHG